MRKRLTGAVLAGLLLGWSGGAAAQDAGSPAPEEQASREIEVTGQRRLEREQVVESLRNLRTPQAFNEVVPRFHDPVCPKVTGINDKSARLIEARISAVADYVGLPRPKPKCRPNAVVLILENPPQMFDKVIEKRFGLIGPNEVRDLHLNTIRADLKAGKPLVAWNQIAERNYDGVTAEDGGAIPGLAGGSFLDGVLVTQSPLSSRLRSSIYQAKQVAVVVFDAKQLTDVEPIQLADLAAIYLLGWPRRTIDYDTLGAASLLTLFRTGPKQSPEEMTDFDRAYLKGIYNLRPNDWSSRLYRMVLAAYDKQCVDEGVACPGDDPVAE
jgi:hypothetical protein